MSSYFDQIKRYVDFTAADSRALAALSAAAVPHFPQFAAHFYERIAAHPDAAKVIDGPEQIARLKSTLIDWMRSGLEGPHDDDFYKRRCRIGRVHVQIGLPQQYMFTAMNVMRLDFRRLIRTVYADDSERERSTEDALDKLFDLELAIMLQTYQQDSEDRVRRNERLATIGQVAASIGHDLRNPLSVIQSSVFLLEQRFGDNARAASHLRRIDSQVELCDDIIKNLLELARNQPPRRTRISFEEVVDRALAGLTLPAGIRSELDVEDGLELHADSALLAQAVGNLINNAVQAYNGQPGTIYISAHNDDDGHVVIEIADDGPGFDSETIARVFEPLVTTRPSGIGLGLALVKGVTERHGGVVEALNRPQGGAAVRIRIPNTVEKPDG